MHQVGNRDKAMTQMKGAVLSVKEIIHRLPIPVPEVEEDFRLAHALVIGMVEKQQITKPEKPSLNMEDLYF